MPGIMLWPCRPAPSAAGMFRYVVALALLVSTAAAAAEPIYKWVDAEGKTHFSSRPPPGRKLEPMTLHPSTPDPVDAPATASWQDQLQRSGEQRLQRQQQSEKEAKEKKLADQDCQAARRALNMLGGDRPVFRTNAAGEKEYLEDNQRQAALEAAQQRVATACR